MLFMCHGIWRDLDEQGQHRMIEVYEHWHPPQGLKIHNRWVTPSGQDFVLVEADSVEVLAESAANWAPFIDYSVYPVSLAEDVVPGMKRAAVARETMR